MPLLADDQLCLALERIQCAGHNLAPDVLLLVNPVDQLVMYNDVACA